MTNRVCLGKQSDGTYGLKVSEFGYNVLSNHLDDERLIFNSEWASINAIFKSGEFQISAGGTVTIPFGLSLGFSPYFYAQWVDGTTIKKESMKYDAYSGATIAPSIYSWAYVDRIYFRNMDTRPYSVQYLIFKTKAFQ